MGAVIVSVLAIALAGATWWMSAPTEIDADGQDLKILSGGIHTVHHSVRPFPSPDYPRPDGLPTLVQFAATWCDVCHAMEPVMANVRRATEGRLVVVESEHDGSGAVLAVLPNIFPGCLSMMRGRALAAIIFAAIGGLILLNLPRARPDLLTRRLAWHQLPLARSADAAGFDWVFAVASLDLYEQLAGTFGYAVLNPAVTPHFVIRPDGSTSALATGDLSVESLIESLSTNGGV